MAKEKYLLKKKQGKHVEEDVMYGPGDVVESGRPLDKLFPGRFKKLEGVQAKKAEASEGVPLNEPAPAAEEVPAAQDEDEDEDEEEEVDEVESSKGDDEDTKALTMEQGEDFTAKFADASKAGFKVFKNADGYTVVDATDVTKVVSKKPLANKAAVKEFLKDYV